MIQTVFSEDEALATINALAVFIVHLEKEKDKGAAAMKAATGAALAKFLTGVPEGMSKEIISKFGAQGFSVRVGEVPPQNQALQ